MNGASAGGSLSLSFPLPLPLSPWSVYPAETGRTRQLETVDSGFDEACYQLPAASDQHRWSSGTKFGAVSFCRGREGGNNENKKEKTSTSLLLKPHQHCQPNTSCTVLIQDCDQSLLSSLSHPQIMNEEAELLIINAHYQFMLSVCTNLTVSPDVILKFKLYDLVTTSG